VLTSSTRFTVMRKGAYGGKDLLKR